MRVSRWKTAQLPKLERPDEWDVKTTAHFLGVHPNWVYRHAEELPGGFILGNRWRFRPDAIRAWYASHGTRVAS